MKEFADLQKRPDRVPEQPIKKPLQTDDIWPKPKKKVAGYGAGGYGKTVPGGFKGNDPYGLDAQVYGDNGPPNLDNLQVAAPRSVVRLKGNDLYGLDAQVYGDKPPKLDKPQAAVEQKSVTEAKAGGDNQDIQTSAPQFSPLTPLKPEPIQVASATLTPGMLAPSPQLSPESLFGVANGGTALPFSVPMGANAAPVLMAQTIPFPTQGAPLLRGVPLPKIPAVPPWVIPWIMPGISPFELLPGAGSKELEWERQNRARQRSGTPQQTAPSISSPQPSKPDVALPIVPVQQQEPKPQSMPVQDVQQQQWEQEQQQREREFQAQQDKFKAQQVAQQQLLAKQDKLNSLSAGFMLNEEHVTSFEAQLTPSQKGSLTKEVNERYKALTGLAQQADNPLMPYEVAEIKQKIRQQVLYERYVPVREINHFGNQFLNGYTPQKMKAVRGYFDQVFEGNYSKRLPADKQKAIKASADEQYIQETRQQKVDRNSPLWKTLRNVETSEKFPDLWDQFRQDLSKAPSQPMGIMTGEPLPPVGGFGEGPGVKLPPVESFPTGGKPLPPLGGFDNTAKPELMQPETFPTNEKVDGVSHVFAAKEGEIPGVDIPFRKVNPRYPANQDVLEKARSINLRNTNLDCSEIAETLLKSAGGKGQIVEVKPVQGKDLRLYESGKVDGGFTYHQVYTDGRYVYDPRVSSDPIPKGDWEIMIRSLNPESNFNHLN